MLHLKCLSKYCYIEMLKIIYFSRIHLQISFGIVLYGPTSDINMYNVLLLQKRAICAVLKLRQQVSLKQQFTSLGIEKAHSRVSRFS